MYNSYLFTISSLDGVSSQRHAPAALYPPPPPLPLSGIEHGSPGLPVRSHKNMKAYGNVSYRDAVERHRCMGLIH
jgi:hypothetical protein